MNLIWIVIAVIVVFIVVFFIDKKLFVNWVVNGLEIVAVALLSLFIAYTVCFTTQKITIGSIAVGIIFYFFGAMIRPYIKEFVTKITKNFDKKIDKNNE